MRRPLKETLSPEEYEQLIEERRKRKSESNRMWKQRQKQKQLKQNVTTGYEQLRNDAMEAAMADFEADQHIEETDQRIRDNARQKADIEMRTGGKTAEQVLQEVDERVRNIRSSYGHQLNVDNVYGQAIDMVEDWASNMKQPDQQPTPKNVKPERDPHEKPRPKAEPIKPADKDDDRKNYVVGTYRRIARNLAGTYDSGNPLIESPNAPHIVPDKSKLEQQFEGWLYQMCNIDNVRVDSAIRNWMKEHKYPDNQIDVAMARAESVNELITQGCRHGDTKHVANEMREIFQSVLKTAHIICPYNLSLKSEQRLSEEREKQQQLQYLVLLMMPTTILLTLLSKAILWKVGPTHTAVDLVGMSQTKLQRNASAERTGSKALNDKLLSLYVGDIIDILHDRHIPAHIIAALNNEAHMWNSTRYFVVEDQLVNIVEVKERIALGAQRQKPPQPKISAVMSRIEAQVLGSQMGRKSDGYQLQPDGDCFVLRFKPIYFDPKTCVWRYDIEEMLDILRHVHREVMRGVLEWITEVRYNEGTLYIKCDRSHTGYHCQGEALRMSNHTDPTDCARSLASNLYMTRAYVDGCYYMPDAYVLWDLNTNNLREFEQSQYMQLCHDEMQHQQELEIMRAERVRQRYLRQTEQEEQLQTEQPTE